MTTRRLIAGCMTGTSIDSLDAALVEIEGYGLDMRATFRRGVTRPLGALAPRLRALAEQQPMSAGDIAALSREFALLHADALRELAGADRFDLASIHGQTVFHAPPLSWQLLNPAPIAAALRCPVVYDLRAADLAAGGQGAPLTPLADWVLFHRASDRVGASDASIAVVNLGGFCNLTVLPAGGAGRPALDTISGGDRCSCSQLLDAIARSLFHQPFDEDGARALSGQVHARALEDLERILSAQAGRRRSLGTGDEALEWISRWRAHAAPNDLAATACQGIAGVIAGSLEGVGLALLAGGGIRNLALRHAIESCCSCRVKLTDEAGVPSAYREAICFAVLGALCQDRFPITLPQITGVPAPAPISGCWALP